MDFQLLIQTIRDFYPDVQVIYLFGSYNTEFQRDNSDIDMALLLPHAEAKKEKCMALSDCKLHLERISGKTVDLINLRESSTVFQKEVTCTGKVIFCNDENARLEFEMLTLSFYQKLNEERKEILEDFYKTKRAYPV